MKFGKIMGITGGVIGLLYGIVIAIMGIYYGSVGSLLGIPAKAEAVIWLIVIAFIGLPVLSIIGGTIVNKQPKKAMINIGIPAIVFLALGIFAGNLTIAVPGILMAIGAASIFLQYRKLESPIENPAEN